ncbi:MAG: TetR/AcrR family transcriptional regulator [Acidimicrobiia bacterium]
MTARRTQAERSEATRGALIAAATELFATKGFAGTGRDEIAIRAGVTRGALYHHFGSKGLIFRAVVEDLEQRLTDRVALAGLRGETARDRFESGAQEFLDACLEPSVSRVLLLEAPVVLGWDAWHEIEERYGLALVRVSLHEVAGEAGFTPEQVDVLAPVLLGTLQAGALLIATHADPVRARREVGEAVSLVMARLLRP